MVFTAVPHGTSVKIMPQLAASGIKIIDMSADYRLRNPKDYETWYGYTHPQPEMLDQFTLEEILNRLEFLSQTQDGAGIRDSLRDLQIGFAEPAVHTFHT